MQPNEHEALGYWWNEDTPTQQTPGTLRMGQENSYSLHVLGSIGSDLEASPEVDPRPNIHGISAGKMFTLIAPWRTQVNERTSELGVTDTDERWTGFTLIEGGHISASTKFGQASISYVGLSSLWDKALPRGTSDEESMLETQGEFVDSEEGHITFTRSRTSHYGRGKRSHEDQISVRIKVADPLTLDEWSEKYWHPLATIVSLATGRASESSGFILYRQGVEGREEEPMCNVDRWKAKEDSAWARHESLVGTSDIFLPIVLQNWIAFSSALIKPMVIASPTNQTGYLDTETFTAIAAAEQLQRHLDGDLPTPFADEVRQKLKAHAGRIELNSSARRRIVSSLTTAEHSLEKRLKLLTSQQEPNIYTWYFQGHIDEWAKSSAKVRNILGHGLLGTKHSSLDPMLLLDARDAARDVIAIRLLLECGFPESTLLERLEANPEWSWRRTRMTRWSEHIRNIESLAHE